MTRTAGTLLVTIAAALLIGAAPGHAGTASPTKGTTYQGTSVDGGTTITVSLKIGKSTRKIKKAVVDLTCAEGGQHMVFKNVRVGDTGFFNVVDGAHEIQGNWESKGTVDVWTRGDSDAACGFPIYNVKAKRQK